MSARPRQEVTSPARSSAATERIGQTLVWPKMLLLNRKSTPEQRLTASLAERLLVVSRRSCAGGPSAGCPTGQGCSCSHIVHRYVLTPPRSQVGVVHGTSCSRFGQSALPWSRKWCSSKD